MSKLMEGLWQASTQHKEKREAVLLPSLGADDGRKGLKRTVAVVALMGGMAAAWYGTSLSGGSDPTTAATQTAQNAAMPAQSQAPAPQPAVATAAPVTTPASAPVAAPTPVSEQVAASVVSEPAAAAPAETAVASVPVPAAQTATSPVAAAAPVAVAMAPQVQGVDTPAPTAMPVAMTAAPAPAVASPAPAPETVAAAAPVAVAVAAPPEAVKAPVAMPEPQAPVATPVVAPAVAPVAVAVAPQAEAIKAPAMPRTEAAKATPVAPQAAPAAAPVHVPAPAPAHVPAPAPKAMPAPQGAVASAATDPFSAPVIPRKDGRRPSPQDVVMASMGQSDPAQVLANPVPRSSLNQGTSAPRGPGVTVESNGTSTIARYKMEAAYAALIRGDAATALRIYDELLAGSPSDRTQILFGKATALQRAGKIVEARAAYEGVLASDPDNPQALTNLMGILAQDTPTTAINELSHLARVHPEFSPVHALLGTLYAKLGDTQQAIDNLTRAVRLAPTNPTYQLNLAIVLDRAGQASEARKYYLGTLSSAKAVNEPLPVPAQVIQERIAALNG